MQVRSGQRYISAVCATSIVVVKGPPSDIDLRCGGTAMLPAGTNADSKPGPAEGYDLGTVIGKRYWAQTNSRYGQLTFFTGLASDGEAWVGYTRRVGWTTINRFSSSGGASAKFTCSRMTGC